MINLNLSKLLLVSLSVSLILFTATPMQVKAVDTPHFPSCSNPEGTIKADYPGGTHGIAGNSTEFKGSDKVYTLSDNTLQQCFCSIDGAGIQTNWWKASSLTQGQIEVLKKDNWVLIPDGSLWGLQNAPYLAKNSNYSCSGGGTGGEILGASISLPKTGAESIWLIIALASLVSGLVILFKGLRSKKRI